MTNGVDDILAAAQLEFVGEESILREFTDPIPTKKKKRPEPPPPWGGSALASRLRSA